MIANTVLLFAWFWAAFVGLDQRPRVTMRATPNVVREGEQVLLECRVRRHADHRRIDFGIEDVRISSQGLDGANAAVSYQLTIQAMPCLGNDLVRPFCQVTDAYNHVHRVTTLVSVVCE